MAWLIASSHGQSVPASLNSHVIAETAVRRLRAHFSCLSKNGMTFSG